MMFPKGPTRKQIKGKKRRHAAKVVKSVRQQCVDRDGWCRLRFPHQGDTADFRHNCAGPSEWAHLGEKKRARTRGMPPEARHTTTGSVMLCKPLHDDYDAGRIAITGNPDHALAFTLTPRPMRTAPFIP